jgi:predicted MFS family arabinose efflux permease
MRAQKLMNANAMNCPMQTPGRAITGANGESSLGRGRVAFLAALAALTVANVCYPQPLVAEFARDFHVSEKSAGVVTALSQIGYGTGILAIVPFGDLKERRKLIVALLGAVALSLILAALAPNIRVLALAGFLVGATTIIPQVVIPYAAALSPTNSRAATIGTIQSALLIGILLARTAAGGIAQLWGWRSVYWISSALMATLALLVWFTLPPNEPAEHMDFLGIVRSMKSYFEREPVLRIYSTSSALCYASFSVFWSTLAFLLYAPPHHHGPGVAGSFGLAGVAGALAVPFVARWSSQRGTHFTGGLGLAMCLLSIPLFYFGRNSLLLLGASVMLIDLGLQANHVSNQAEVLSLHLKATSRLNGIYMFMRFLGGAFGSLTGAWAWVHFGWAGVCWAGVALICDAWISHSKAANLVKSGNPPAPAAV